eukprot:scaffold54073_cov60-Phaeocystis_antarctica.AAC.1
MPIAAFGMMLVSEISVLVFARGFPRMTFSYMRYPVMSVHATSLFYYLVELFLTTHTMIDAFGRPIYPLRYVMWTCSVPRMLILTLTLYPNPDPDPTRNPGPSPTPITPTLTQTPTPTRSRA